MRSIIAVLDRIHATEDNQLHRRTADSFATVKQQGTGWTWEPLPIGLGALLSAPPVPYISQRAAYEGLQRAITALCREGIKENRRCAE